MAAAAAGAVTDDLLRDNAAAALTLVPDVHWWLLNFAADQWNLLRDCPRARPECNRRGRLILFLYQHSTAKTDELVLFLVLPFSTAASLSVYVRVCLLLTTTGTELLLLVLLLLQSLL